MSTPQSLLVIDPVLSSSNGGVFKSKFRMLPGRFELTSSRIVFYKKSSFWMAFGLIGVLVLARLSGKRDREIELHRIAGLARGKYGFNKKILDLTLVDGATLRLTVDNFDEFSERLRAELARRATVTAAGPEQWRVSA